MKKLFLFSILLAITILPGCGKSDLNKNTSNDAWLLYTNEAQGFAIPYLDSWNIKEFKVPADFPFAIIGFDPEPITHDTPAKTDNGKIVMQVYNGPYMQKLIDKQKQKPGYSGTVKTFGKSVGMEISFETPEQKFSYMTVVEKNGKTFILATEELSDIENINVYEKMAEGLSLD